jgi:PTH1 family peptidyl-tRNA hydrolase
MKLIVGLGNPGAEYERTRHNIGWQVVDAFAAKFRIDVTTHEKDALTGRGRVAGGAVMIAKPQTYMNNSGDAVRLLTNVYTESLDDLIVVYDDIDLPVGKLRVRSNGSSGTHNGMRSIVARLSSERFARLRFGVRGPGYEQVRQLRDYVLDDFDATDAPHVERGIARAVDALVLFARGDLKRAMNEFNRDPADESPKPDKPVPEPKKDPSPS